MARRKYTADPDRGTPPAGPAKRAEMLSPEAFAARAETREGARELDRMLENTPGLRRAQRDRDRLMPRETVAPLEHSRMQRRLPGTDAVRTSLSSRQRKARSKTKHAMQDQLRNTEYDTIARAITDYDYWSSINNELSDVAGDIGDYSETARLRVQRLDRVIQRYEAHNSRGHVVYTNVKLPSAVNAGNVAGFVNNHLPPGAEVNFDRFTAATHTMHEVESDDLGDHVPVFEIQTRRGAYLGHSDSSDDTRHVLPRGMKLYVLDQHLAQYRRPDGSIGLRRVVQLSDQPQR